MQIPNEAIERLKREVDLVALVRSYGVELKKRGRSYVGLCPFHKEEKPSFTVNPNANLYNCFGCPTGDNGGNAITFVMKKEGVGFREAFEKLAQRPGDGSAPPRPAPTAAPRPPASDEPRSRVRRQKLLDRVAAYYRRCFCEKSAGREYLASRGLTDQDALEAYGAGLCDGSLHEIAPHDEAISADLKAIGILTESGRELFEGCVVFPLIDDQRATVGMYGRRMHDGEVNHLYLPGPRRGLANRFGVSGTVVLCESVLDALSLSVHGVCALGCYGVKGFTADHLALLASPRVSEVVVCFDGDAAGREGAAAAVEQLRSKGKAVRVVDLPEGHDLNDLLVSEGAETLIARLGLSAAVGTTSSAGGAGTGIATFEATKNGFILRREARVYEVKHSTRQGTQLRAAVKATRGDGQFELSSVDLYSHRSRQYFAALCAQLFGVDESRTRDDLNEVLLRVESSTAKEQEAEAATAGSMTEADRAEAEAFLASPTLIEEIAADIDRIGYAGERTNKLVCYLVAISRKCDDPLSVLIQSRSGAGKSALQDAILSLVPEEDALAYSRLTDQALFYQKEDAMVHKLLAIEEADGMGGAAYSIRVMQSAKKLRVAMAAKDPATGKMRTEENTVRGPTGVMITTTRTDFDQETLSRFLCVTVDESEAMTRRIHERQRFADTREGILARRAGERIRRKHHNAQRLLQPLTVLNPYAQDLTYPVASLRTRRDNKKYLGLIKAITFLHQRQRHIVELDDEGEKVRCVVTTLEDIALANDLTLELLRNADNDMTPQGVKLREVIRAMVRERSQGEVKRWFSRRELREYSHWTDWQLKTHLAELVELEYLHVRQGERGREYIYVLEEEVGGANETTLGLTPTAELIERVAAKHGEVPPVWPRPEQQAPAPRQESKSKRGAARSPETELEREIEAAVAAVVSSKKSTN